MNLTISLGDVLAIGAFVFYAGANFMMLKQHGVEIKSLRSWKHNEVTPDLLDLKLRVGLIEETKGR